MRLTESGSLSPILIKPFRLLISGPSMAGKSHLIFNILKNKAYETTFSKINYYYAEYQSKFSKIKGVNFIKNIPNKIPPETNALFIFDDLMDQLTLPIMNLFTKESHQRNISIILTVQNLFFSNKYFRTLSLNASHLVIFKSPRDGGQVRYISAQMFPNNSSFVVRVYEKATQNKPYSYIWLDFTQTTHDKLCVWSDIFSEEPILWLENNDKNN